MDPTPGRDVERDRIPLSDDIDLVLEQRDDPGDDLEDPRGDHEGAGEHGEPHHPWRCLGATGGVAVASAAGALVRCRHRYSSSVCRSRQWWFACGAGSSPGRDELQKYL